MAGAWTMVVYFCLTLPFLLLTFLLLPAPRPFHRAVLNLVDRTLGLTFVGLFSLLHVMLSVSAVIFASCLQTTYKMEADKSVLENVTPGNIYSDPRLKKARAQRNFWISLFSLSLWVILARVYQILLAKKRLEDEMRGRPARPTGVDTAPTRPTAAAGSATKKAT